MTEKEIDKLLAAFQRACEIVVTEGDSHLSATTKERAIVRNELRAKLIGMGRAKHCVDTLLVAFRQVERVGGNGAKMHVGDCIKLIEEFQKGTMDKGAPITGPFYDASVQ